jgi:hypothetical protein
MRDDDETQSIKVYYKLIELLNQRAEKFLLIKFKYGN